MLEFFEIRKCQHRWSFQTSRSCRFR
jgi:hypothetical protein